MTPRYWWTLRLADPAIATPTHRAGLTVRTVESGDAELLAQLMLDAYEGTIDSEDETIVEAREEIARWFQGNEVDAVAATASVIAITDAPPAAAISATLVSPWELHEVLIGFVITAPACKNTGLGRVVLDITLRRLAEAGIANVRAAITAGNTASERLFAAAGFTRGDTIGP